MNSTLNLEKDQLLPEFSKATLKDRYLLPSEQSPQEAFMRASRAFADDEAHAQRLYTYASNLWFMFSTPILANAGSERGLPISCNLQYVPDSRAGLFDHYQEAGTLSTMGAGLGGYWGHIRSDGVSTSKGSASSGSIPFMKVMDSIVLGFKQGKTRRSSYAVYQDISHPEVLEFLDMRNPTGGDSNRRCLNLHHGINITDAFMKKVEALSQGDLWHDHQKLDEWNLIDPHSKQTTSTTSVKALWQKILETRAKTGEPYLHFIDTSNRAMPVGQRDKGLRIHQSNLCVAGDTYVQVKFRGEPSGPWWIGRVHVSALVGIPTKIWNGFEWSEVTFQKTGENKKLLQVGFSNGESLDCTPEHRFYLKDGQVKEAQELQVGDTLEDWYQRDGSIMPYSEYLNAFVTVSSISPLTGLHDTFCATEPKRHKIMFNGIVTGNCNEIMLPTSEDRTAVCCLSSVNLEYFEAWKHEPLFIEDIIRMLDNVITYYIKHAASNPSLKKAVYSASQERSLGLGAMGFHALLQSKSLPFESQQASALNHKVFEHINKFAHLASRKLLLEGREQAPDSRYYEPKRNMHLMAIAPNASSGIICGNTSPSIEPYRANAYTHKTESGTFIIRNKHLERLLQSLDQSTPEVWESITLNAGSVQHLDFLSLAQKAVFKTAPEIDQRWVIDHAGARQPFICQGQSLNLFVSEDISVAQLHHLHMMAWKKGLKGLYYLRTDLKNRGSGSEKTNTTNTTASTINHKDYDVCVSCEG